MLYEIVRDLTTFAIEGKQNRAGRLAYNFGEFLTFLNQHRPAIKMFRLACELDPDYATKGYLFEQAGGNLFRKGRYTAASFAYVRVLRMERVRNPSVFLLFAESQLMRGRTGSAFFWSEVGLASKAISDDERLPAFMALNHAVKILRFQTGSTRVHRKTLAARELTESSMSMSDENAIGVLEKAVTLDPMDCEIWFLLGQRLNEMGEREKTVRALFLSSVLSNGNLDNWLNLILVAFTSRVSPNHLALFLSAAGVYGYDHLAELARE